MSGTNVDTRRFLETKARTLAARAGRLSRLTPDSVGIRPQDRPYAPSAAHYEAANRRLAAISRSAAKRLENLNRILGTAPPQQVLIAMSLVEREIDRARRAFGHVLRSLQPARLLFRSIACCLRCRCGRLLCCGPPDLADHLRRAGAQAACLPGTRLFSGDVAPRRDVEAAPRRDKSVSGGPHSLGPGQSLAVSLFARGFPQSSGGSPRLAGNSGSHRRRSQRFGDPLVATTFARWHKEIFADLAAVLLGGTASVWGMMEFLSHASPAVLTFRPGGAHPTGYLRVFILAEMLRRMGFGDDAASAERVWRTLYDPRRGHRIPVRLLQTGRPHDPGNRRRDRLSAAPQSGAACARRCHPLSAAGRA